MEIQKTEMPKTNIPKTETQKKPEQQTTQESQPIPVTSNKPEQNTAPEADDKQDSDILQFVPDVHYELIPIKNLVSNQEYQRNLSARHVKRAAEHFDLYQINPVKVSRRDGINYVFNGQHTIEIIALVSGSRETPVWCMIYDDLVYAHEADIFANQQKYVKPLLPYEIFMANVEAGNDKQLIIKELVESYSLPQQHPRRIHTGKHLRAIRIPCP